MIKVKYSAFEKGENKPAIDDNKVNEIMNNDEDNPSDINQKLLDHQIKDAEKKLEQIGDIKKTKGKTSAIFKNSKFNKGEEENKLGLSWTKLSSKLGGVFH